MNEELSFRDYTITTDPLYLYDNLNYTDELKELLNDLFVECQQKNNKKIINKLNSVIVKYPEIPHFKNFLSIAYEQKGNYNKCIEINEWIDKEHPDFIFAKLNKANDLLSNGYTDEIPIIIGDSFDLKALYPERNIFHLDEFTAFYRVVVRYFAKIGDLNKAEEYFLILKEVAPDDSDTEKAEFYLFPLRLIKGKERWEEENRVKIKPVNLKVLPVTNNTNPPQFNHSEINKLYNYSCNIPHETLEEILSLPRTTLIEDLEKMLVDAVNRYDYFVKEGWSDENNNFVIHSIFILTEMNSKESVSKILSFLEYDSNFLDFWLGDFQTEYLWQCFFKLGIDQTNVLKDFLLTPGIDTYSKTSVSTALSQILLHYPEKKEDILSIYSDIFNAFLYADKNKNLIDSYFLAFAISDTIDCNLVELLPVIKLLFESDYVSLGISGDYDDIKEEFKNLNNRIYKKETKSIFEIYENVTLKWYDYSDNEYKDNKKDYQPKYIPIANQQAVSTKIGRNEPCPCGSGKKYKKCCMDK